MGKSLPKWGRLGRRYPWGNEADTSKANYERAQQTEEVGSYDPQMYGLYQMSGNVWEWCEDYWTENYCDGSVTDTTCPLSVSSRVVRGGGYFDIARLCRSTSRRGQESKFNYFDLGFRLARKF